jgi:general secretion pathway protein N
MRMRAIAALGIAAYVVFLVAAAPASFVAACMSAALPGRVTLTDTRGTLWAGSAHARVIAHGGPVFLDRLEWRLRPSRLAAGRLAFDIRGVARGLDAQLQVARGFSGWELRDVTARVEAAIITAFAPWIAAWRPEGTLMITSPAMDWDEREARGQLSLEWRNAAVSLSEVRPLGSYRLEARAEGGPARLTVATLDGALKVSGQGIFTPPSRLAFSGEARAEGEQTKALEPLLDLIGPRRPDGARALEIRMTWSRSDVEKDTGSRSDVEKGK